VQQCASGIAKQFLSHNVRLRVNTLDYIRPTTWTSVRLEKLIIAELVNYFQLFMEIEGRFITVLKEPASGLYPERNESSQHPNSYVPKIRFNIILPPTSRYSEWPFPSGLQTKIVYAFIITYSTFTTHHISIWIMVQFIESLTVQFSPASCHFTFVVFKCSS